MKTYIDLSDSVLSFALI